MAKKKNRTRSTSARPVQPAASVSVVENKPIRRPVMSAPFEFNPDYTPVIKDLKRIGILAGSFLVVLIALSFILN